MKFGLGLLFFTASGLALQISRSRRLSNGYNEKISTARSGLAFTSMWCSTVWSTVPQILDDTVCFTKQRKVGAVSPAKEIPSTRTVWVSKGPHREMIFRRHTQVCSHGTRSGLPEKPHVLLRATPYSILKVLEGSYGPTNTQISMLSGSAEAGNEPCFLGHKFIHLSV
jgi:hypothetical protein